MFSYISLEERVPQAHPLRKLRVVVDALLATMNREFEAVYAGRGRPSVPPEMLLKALLLQILFSIRSERRLVEAVNYNLLYRWFVGLNIEDKVWDHSTFSANRERLFNEDLARAFFERVKPSAQWSRLASGEHFSGDGTLIDVWVSHKSFKRKDDDSSTPPGCNPEVDFKGQERCNETHASGTAEREAALAMLERRGIMNKRATVGADKGYDSKAFIKGCRRLKVTPHVVAKDKHSAMEAAFNTTCATKPVRRCASESKRPLAGPKLNGQAKFTVQALLCFATYNLVVAWAASAAGGTRIMRELQDTCARNGQKGLRSGRNALRNRFAGAPKWLATSETAIRVRSMGISQRPANQNYI